MKPKVFIDGKEGTTGLQIYERLGSREDIELLLISEEKRKDTEERRKFLNEADIVFLCLPDAAAKEAVGLIENGTTRVIDASTAHRTAPGWTYGFPELDREQRAKIASSKRVANPGCHATGFIAAVAPLVRSGVISADAPLSCFSLTGYSGGGKKMIAQYGDENRDPALDSPRIYGTALMHKHLPEMTAVTGLSHAPVFCPIVADYYSGMQTVTSLPSGILAEGMTAERIHGILADWYAGEKLVRVAPFTGGVNDYLASNVYSGTNGLEIFVGGSGDSVFVASRFDNLGKGASGAAVQNMNIMLGLDETAGL